jgi:hypothetical protein
LIASPPVSAIRAPANDDQDPHEVTRDPEPLEQPLEQQKDRSVNRKGIVKMNCYLCDNGGEATDAVAICQHCGVALCRDHVDQDLLAHRPAGLVRRGCTHNPLGAAAARRKDLEELRNLEALW